MLERFQYNAQIVHYTVDCSNFFFIFHYLSLKMQF
jgi:hypothetical protein